MADLKAFAEQLVNLSVKEVNELAQILKMSMVSNPPLLLLQLLLVLPLVVPLPRRRSLLST